MVLGSKSAHWKSGTEEGKQIGTLEVWNRGGKGGKKELLTRTIRGRRSHLLWSSPDPSPVLAFARRQKEVAGRGSSPEGADQRREEGSSLAAPAGRGGGGGGNGLSGGNGGSAAIGSLGVGMAGRGRNVWRWPLGALLSSNPSGLWASQFLTGPQTI